mmetsp:Transcript_88305/g.205451  ORF Transcript_88305/g.205451 Transcript_88305/m.205451 type:complete len:328 (-) Transcript_88305:79-1062(-)
MGQAVGASCSCCGGENTKVQRQALLEEKHSPKSSARSDTTAARDEEVVLPATRVYDQAKPNTSTPSQDDEEETIELKGLAWAKKHVATCPGEEDEEGCFDEQAQQALQPVPEVTLDSRPVWARANIEEPRLKSDGQPGWLAPLMTSMNLNDSNKCTNTSSLNKVPEATTEEEDEKSRRGSTHVKEEAPTKAHNQSRCCGLAKNKRRKISNQTRAKIMDLFCRMDTDGNGEVTKDEAMQFFQKSGTFGRLSVQAMFNEVDTDKSDCISAEEFWEFWQQVCMSGYSERQLCEEIDSILEGGAWVDWEDNRKVVQLARLNSRISKDSSKL